MKRIKKLTRSDKEVLSNYGLYSKSWGKMEETEFFLKVINRVTGKVLRLDKNYRDYRGLRNDKEVLRRKL